MVDAYKKLRILLAVWCFVQPVLLCAQGRVNYSWEQFVGDYYEYVADLVEESDNYVERYDWLEELEEMHRHRIDINSCDRDELHTLRFLSEEQIDSLIAKRNRYAGGIGSVGELMAIPQLGYRERAWLSLFLTFDPPPAKGDAASEKDSNPQTQGNHTLGQGSSKRVATSDTNRWYGGAYEVLGTLEVPLYRRAGFYDYDDTNYETKMFTGYNSAHTLRVRYNWRQRVMYGVTVQEDVGERFGVYGGHPWDYQSAYFFYKSDPVVRRETSHRRGSGEQDRGSRIRSSYNQISFNRFTLAAGDYRLSLGQGLIMGSNGWTQQTSIFNNLRMETTGIRPHTGTDESRFLRGAAANVRLGRNGQWTLAAFGSFRKLDGTLRVRETDDDDLVKAADDVDVADDGAYEYISAWKTDGLHRTLQEIDKRHVAIQLLAGGRAGFASRGLNVGVNGVWLHYNKPYEPAPRAYNKYYMSGCTASAFSLDYTYRRRMWSLQGEFALDGQGHYASTATVRYRPHRSVLLVAQERSVSKEFVSPYGHTLMANSQIQNEHAVLLGAQWRPSARLQFMVYGDWALHPSAVYLADTTSHRFSVMLQGSLRTDGNWTHSLTYRFKGREQNVTGYRDIPDFDGVLLSWRTTQHVRWQSLYARKRWNVAVGADGACYFSQGSAYDKKAAVITGGGTSLGALLYARSAVGMLHDRLHLSAMIAGFATDDYYTRCYAYIPMLRGSVSIPNFYGTGVQGVLMAECRTWRNLYVAARLSMVHYFDRDTISSGVNLIDSASKNDLSLQLRYRY